MVISADLKKQQQYFDKNIALLHYLFIAKLLVKIARQNC
jgi:hypothetical protein